MYFQVVKHRVLETRLYFFADKGGIFRFFMALQPNGKVRLSTASLLAFLKKKSR